jgi:hypothetical protein
MGDAVDKRSPEAAEAAVIGPDGDRYDLFQPVGKSGLIRFGGYVNEEFLPQLKNVKGRQTIREMMDNDPVVGAALLTTDMLARQVKWSMRPASNGVGPVQPADQEISDFVWSALHDMEDTWPDTVSDHLTMIPFGWAWAEEVYKWRQGDNTADDGTASKHADGLMGWLGIQGRAQETLYRWDFDNQGRARAMLQQAAPDFAVNPIPHAKSLHFRTSAAKNNPEGRSALRRAYRPWYFKRRIEELEGIGIERDLAGLPVFKAPLSLFSSSATDREKSLLAALRNMVRQVRRNEAEGLVVPLDYDENGNATYEFELMRGAGNRQFNTDVVVSRHDQRIAMALLADFILLGHEGTGGGGGLGVTLGATKVDLFTAMLSTVLTQIRDEYNDRAIPHLLRYNGIDLAAAPTLDFGAIDRPDLSVLGNYVFQLAQAGIPMGMNSEVVGYLLEQAEIPYEGAEEL